MDWKTAIAVIVLAALLGAIVFLQIRNRRKNGR